MSNNDRKQKPAHTIKCGPIEAAIWENDGKEGAFFTFTLGRFYKDRNDEWQTSDSFGARNELDAIQAVQQATSWIRSQEGRAAVSLEPTDEQTAA